MSILDIVGPVIAIGAIYLVYKIFMDMETKQKEKETSIEISKIEAQTELDKTRLQREKQFIEYSDKHDKQLPFKDTDVEYKILDDRSDEKNG